MSYQFSSLQLRILLEVDADTNWLDRRVERTRDAELLIKCLSLSYGVVKLLLVTVHRATGAGNHVDHSECKRLSQNESFSHDCIPMENNNELTSIIASRLLRTAATGAVIPN
jgi:hypothetical protein